MHRMMGSKYLEECFEEGLMLNQSVNGSGSAFVGYYNTCTSYRSSGGLPHENINANKRMIEFLKRRTNHMMSRAHQRLKRTIGERIRRREQKQSYEALHSLLPPGTKNDKKSILEKVTKEIEELQQYKEDLKRKEKGMKRLLGWSWTENEENKSSVEIDEVSVRVRKPASGIDSMLEVLKCLKNTPTTSTTAIRSTFSEHQFTAAFQFETEKKGTQVEKAIQKTLFEAEMKFRNQMRVPKGNK